MDAGFEAAAARWTHDWMRRQPSRDGLVVDSGDIDRTLTNAATVESDDLHPHQMHGSMARRAVADVGLGPLVVADTIVIPLEWWARAHRLPVEKVRVIFTRGSGATASTARIPCHLMPRSSGGGRIRIQLTAQRRDGVKLRSAASSINESD
jgi:hypothetical protein